MDFGYLTNRIIVFLSLASFISVLVYQLFVGTSVLSGLNIAFATGFAVFLSWALGREIDPASDWSAFVALPATFIIALLYGGPAFMALLFILLFSRALNGTTGTQATFLDSVILIIIGGVLHFDGITTALPVLALVFILDRLLKPVNREQAYFVLASVIIFGVLLVIMPEKVVPFQGLSSYTAYASFLLIIAAAVVIYMTRSDRTYNSKTGLQLRSRRVFASQALIVLFMLAEIFSKGSSAFLYFYPAMAAYCGAALFHLAGLIRPRQKQIARD